MAQDKRDVLEVLQFEPSFLEQGGYGRSVRTLETDFCFSRLALLPQLQ
jgi:hypothetical protein